MDQSVAKGDAAAGQADLPLVVDLDGTLTRSDVFLECLVAALAERPDRLLSLPAWLAAGRARTKACVAGLVPVDAARLPLRPEVIDLLRREHARGRRIMLATASDRAFADAVAAEVGLFESVFASDGATNLKGEAKAAALVSAFGAGGFDYIGDAAADLPVFAAARTAYVVEASPGFLDRIRRAGGRPAALSPPSPRLGPLVEAMRLHQWAKNLLVVVPAAAAHRFDPATIGLLLLTFLAFGLTASAVYLVNDMVDIRADRQHARKRHRPFASGALPLAAGLAAAPVLFLSGLALAAAVSPALLAVLGLYVLATFAYSIGLKRLAIVDVAALAGLYTVRLVAGGVAAGIWLSPWLLGFSVFLFLSLAMVKRLTELRACVAEGRGDPAGRGYRVEDVPVLLALAGAAGYAAVVVLALYIESADMRTLYATSWGLWAAAGLLLFWISRVLLIAQRGEMHDDPIVFAFRDRTSRATGLLVTVAVLSSSVG